jgi:hypothetical protein
MINHNYVEEKGSSTGPTQAFRDLRSVPETGTEWPVLRSFSYINDSWDFFTF